MNCGSLLKTKSSVFQWFAFASLCCPEAYGRGSTLNTGLKLLKVEHKNNKKGRSHKSVHTVLWSLLLFFVTAALRSALASAHQTRTDTFGLFNTVDHSTTYTTNIH